MLLLRNEDQRENNPLATFAICLCRKKQTWVNCKQAHHCMTLEQWTWLLCMGVRRGHKTGICPPLEIWTKNQNFLENLKSELNFRLIDLTTALTVYWLVPVWHSHCTRATFTVLVSCSDELAVHSCSLFFLQRQVAKLASGLFYCWSLLRNYNMATDLQRFTSSNGRRRFSACDCWTQSSWRVV